MLIQNAKNWPKTYECRFLTQGLVSYEDSGAGIALLKKQTIDSMLPSFIGKPVCVDHNNITPKNYTKLREEGVIVGNVISTRFNSEDGWFYSTFIVDTDKAVDLIENKGYSVSCAYDVLDIGNSGLYQDIKYDAEITDGSFTHLALVTEPRYEESEILDAPAMLVNGKKAKQYKTQEEVMFSIFKKNENGKANVNLFADVDGQSIPVADLVKAFVENDKKNDSDKKFASNEDIVDVNGNHVKIGELINVYKKSMNDKKEADKKEADKKEADKKEADKKENHHREGEEAKEEDKMNKKDEQEEDVEGEEKKKDKPEGAVEEEARRAKEDDKKKNSKLEGNIYFTQLENAANNVNVEDDNARPMGQLSRSERAAAWAAKTKRK